MSEMRFFLKAGGKKFPVKHTDSFSEEGKVLDECEIPAGTFTGGVEITEFELVDEKGELWAFRRLPGPIFVQEYMSIMIRWSLIVEEKYLRRE